MDSVDTDRLPPTQYLILEVLAARYRTGEQVWTFPTRFRGALRGLAYTGLVAYKSGVVGRTYLAWLTEAGKTSALSSDYHPLTERHGDPD